MFSLLLTGCLTLRRQKIFSTCSLKREHVLAIEQLFYRSLSLIFKLAIFIVSEVILCAIYQFHIIRHSGPLSD